LRRVLLAEVDYSIVDNLMNKYNAKMMIVNFIFPGQMPFAAKPQKG
jgi:hypothetical protein